MRSTKLTAALLITATACAAVVATVRAETPRVIAPQAQSASMMADNVDEYIEHLRSVRKELNDLKVMLLKEQMSDRAQHRHDAVEGIDKSVDALDKEIVEYKKDMKSGK